MTRIFIASLVLLCAASAARADTLSKNDGIAVPDRRQAKIYVRALASKDARTRRVALEHLDDVADQPAARRSARRLAAIALDDEEPLELRKQALLVLLKLPKRARRPAIKSLWRITRGLKYRDQSVLYPHEVIGLALTVLADQRSRPHKLIPYLFVYMGYPDHFLRACAVDALAMLGDLALPELRARLRGDDYARARQAVRVLARMGKRARPALGDLRAARERFADRESMVRRISRLIEDLTNDREKRPRKEHRAASPTRRITAAPTKLDRVMDRAATIVGVANLRLQLRHHDSRVREAALRALDKKGKHAAAAIPELIALLASDPDPGVRTFAAITLGKLGPAAARAMPALESALTDPHDSVRRYAAYAIGKIGVPSSAGRAMLIAMVAEDRRAAKYAIETLVAIEAHDAIPTLRKAITDSQQDTVQMAAMRAVIALGDSSRPTVEALRKVMSARSFASRTAATMLLKLGDPNDLIPALVVLDRFEHAIPPRLEPVESR